MTSIIKAISNLRIALYRHRKTAIGDITAWIEVAAVLNRLRISQNEVGSGFVTSESEVCHACFEMSDRLATTAVTTLTERVKGAQDTKV